MSKFSILEFALIMGLKCNGEEASRSVTTPQLEDKFSNCDHMLDKLKLGLVFILESVLRC